MSDNTIIPNSYQKPNFFVDRLLYFLTSDEAKVLDLAIREIYGWRDSIAARRANIALSVFSEGKVSKSTGERVAWGTGLSVGTCRKCLDALCSFGIMVKIGQPSPDGQCYGLQENPDAIAWDALKARRAEMEDAAKKRMAKALESRGVMCDITPNVPHNGGGNVPHNGGGNVPLQEGNTVETHIETQYIDAGQKTPAPRKVKAPKADIPEAVKIYREVFQAYPKKNTWATIAEKVVPHNGNMGLWREILEAYKLHSDWNRCNIAALLDYWENKKVPTPFYTQKKTTRGQPLTQAEAQALYNEMQRAKAASNEADQ